MEEHQPVWHYDIPRSACDAVVPIDALHRVRFTTDLEMPRVRRAQLYRLSLVDSHTVAQNGKKILRYFFFCHGIVLFAKV